MYTSFKEEKERGTPTPAVGSSHVSFAHFVMTLRKWSERQPGYGGDRLSHQMGVLQLWSPRQEWVSNLSLLMQRDRPTQKVSDSVGLGGQGPRWLF